MVLISKYLEHYTPYHPKHHNIMVLEPIGMFVISVCSPCRLLAPPLVFGPLFLQRTGHSIEDNLLSQVHQRIYAPNRSSGWFLHRDDFPILSFSPARKKLFCFCLFCDFGKSFYCFDIKHKINDIHYRHYNGVY
jgi:hypothetical protein